MRAMLLVETNEIAKSPLAWREVPDPEPGPGEVRLRVRACAICRTDLHVIACRLLGGLSPLLARRARARGPQNSLTTSWPPRLAMARQMSRFTFSLTNRTLPSHSNVNTPPE